MYTIKKGFINDKNNYFENIRDIHFDDKVDLMSGLGTFITETKYEPSLFFDEEFFLEHGVYLYQTDYDQERALRIYKDFADYPYIFHNDEKLVSELQKRQLKIKYTSFPMGVVSIGNKVVGQEIPYYKDYCTLIESFCKNKINQNPIYYYLEILKILKELYENGIIYSDIHAKNFVVNNNDVKLIDFESEYISFTVDKKTLYTNMISNLKRMLLFLSKVMNISLDQNFNNADNLDDVLDSLSETNYVLTKRIK